MSFYTAIDLVEFVPHSFVAFARRILETGTQTYRLRTSKTTNRGRSPS